MDYTIISIVSFCLVIALLVFYVNISRKNNTNELRSQFNKEMLKLKPILNELDDDVSRCASLGFGNLVVAAILSEKKRILFKVQHLDLDGVLEEQLTDIEDTLRKVKENPRFTKIKTVSDTKQIPRLIKDIKRYKKKLSLAYSRGDVLVGDGSKDIDIISEFEVTISCFYYIKKLKKMNDDKEFQALVIVGKLDAFFEEHEFEMKEKFRVAFNKEAKRAKAQFKSGDGD